MIRPLILALASLDTVIAIGPKNHTSFENFPLRNWQYVNSSISNLDTSVSSTANRLITTPYILEEDEDLDEVFEYDIEGNFIQFPEISTSESVLTSTGSTFLSETTQTTVADDSKLLFDNDGHLRLGNPAEVSERNKQGLSFLHEETLKSNSESGVATPFPETDILPIGISTNEVERIQYLTVTVVTTELITTTIRDKIIQTTPQGDYALSEPRSSALATIQTPLSYKNNEWSTLSTGDIEETRIDTVSRKRSSLRVKVDKPLTRNDNSTVALTKDRIYYGGLNIVNPYTGVVPNNKSIRYLSNSNKLTYSILPILLVTTLLL